jgi:protease-4
MRFLTFVWRFLIGLKDILVLLFMLLFFGLLYTALSASPRVGAGTRGVLLLDLSGPIVEQPATPGAFSLLTSGSSLTRQYRLRDVVHALRTAATDDRVQAVALDLDIFTGGGEVALSDVGTAIDAVRRAKKPVIAYSSAYTDDSYQLAAHASEVWLNPLGTVLLRGPGGSNIYYKGLMDKLGITANVYRVGTYKAAVEPFTRSDMSPEARQAAQALADSLWQSWLDEVRRVRPKAQVSDYITTAEARLAHAGGDLAKTALEAGLVDRIGDRTDFGDRLAQLVGAKDSDVPGSFKSIPLDAWINSNPASDDDGAIGILTIAGDIVDGKAGSGTAGAETIVNRLNEGLKRGNLKALVVRIDSPGGSVLASDRIRRAILHAKAKGLPVVISMGSVAASGGYWVATTGDKIFAEPGTITGSIGVFGIVPSFQGSLAKLGLGADGVKATPLSGEPDTLRGPSAEAGRLIQATIEDVYRRFIGLVAAARHLPPERVETMAEGRVWAGGTAHQLGLVDSFGSLDDAVAEAARRAHIDPKRAKAVFLERKPGILESMLTSVAADNGQAAPDALTRIAAQPRMMLARAFDDAQRLLDGPVLQARCLECGPAAPESQPQGRSQSTLSALLSILAK